MKKNTIYRMFLENNSMCGMFSPITEAAVDLFDSPRCHRRPLGAPGVSRNARAEKAKEDFQKEDSRPGSISRSQKKSPLDRVCLR